MNLPSRSLLPTEKVRQEKKDRQRKAGLSEGLGQRETAAPRLDLEGGALARGVTWALTD